MCNSIALILLLSIPALGQITRGNAGYRVSGLHNHFAVPIDGGKVWTWGMQGPSDCIHNQILNDATFTGSGQDSLQCGNGTTQPTITSKGMNFSTSTGGDAFVTTGANPNLPNGFTISSTFNPTSIATLQICSLINFNYPSNSTNQYEIGISGITIGDFYLAYVTPTGETFVSSTTPITAGVWNTTIAGYTSTVGSSASLWFNNKFVAGAWFDGNTGNLALPAIQVETDVGGVHTFGNPNSVCVGTIGFGIVHDHNINRSAEGFIYRAMYHSMQFRQVALP
jgi:hypothetical protein